MAIQIPIRNIYYLLCYAWGLPEQRERVHVSTEDCKSVSDLFARLLTNGAELLLKRGVQREYIPVMEEVSGIKGKLEITESIKRNSLIKLNTVCSFDEFSTDSLLNRIVYATLRVMISDNSVSKELHAPLVSVFRRFPQVCHIELTEESFRKIQVRSQNRFYLLLMNVCRMIYNSHLPESQQEGMSFYDFTRDDIAMRRLFEDFLFNFYSKECSDKYPIVKRSILKFKVSPLSSEGAKYLPEMKTDVTLDNPSSGKRIIIDAKYYGEMLKSKYSGQQPKYSREHFSQIMGYIQSQEDDTLPYTLETNGIVVYPLVKQGFDMEDYMYQKHRIRFCTVNLNSDWKEIDKRLRQIIQF